MATPSANLHISEIEVDSRGEIVFVFADGNEGVRKGV